MNVLIKGVHIDEIIITPDDEEEQPEPIQEEPLQEEPAQEEPEKPEPKKTASKPAPKKTAPKKNTKPIDKGKIGALHRAGWSAAKIADEMKLGLSTVYKIIKEIQEESK